jgi:hypothetical protein
LNQKGEEVMIMFWFWNNWNKKKRWTIGLTLGFVLLMGLNRCSPIAPNLSKENYQKSPRFSQAPLDTSTSRIYVLRYSNRFVNAFEKERIGKTDAQTTDAQTDVQTGAQDDGKNMSVTFSENSEKKAKEQFLRFKETGETDINLSTVSPLYLPSAIQGVFALETFPIEKYFDLLEPSDLFFFSTYLGRIEDFDSVTTELIPHLENENAWTLELSP